MRRRDFCQLLITALLSRTVAAADSGDEPGLWQALQRVGHVGLLRHALAPGTGDPPDFSVDDCSTQRNLSAAGKAQARKIGVSLRTHGIDNARVFSSQWCRCRDTAELLNVGTVETLALLNSFYASREAGPAQTTALREWLVGRSPGPPILLVTHQVNITALTDVYPASGEMVVVRVQHGRLRVLGSIRTAA